MRRGAARRPRNVQGPFGNTLLHSAVLSGNVAEVERLLKLGANPNIANREGRTPLYAAALFGFKNIHELLRQFGASSSVHDSNWCKAFEPSARQAATEP